MEQQSAFWYSNLDRVTDIAAGAVVLFVFVVILVRLLGKRATAQMNNFDWIIAVATGSLLASGILLKDISFVDAAVAMAVLGLCQAAVTKLFAVAPSIGEKAKATPRMLTHKGHYLDEAMRRERVTKGEINARLREEGLIDVSAANWVIIEADGRLSVIPRSNEGVKDAGCLDGVAYDADLIERLDVKPKDATH